MNGDFQMDVLTRMDELQEQVEDLQQRLQVLETGPRTLSVPLSVLAVPAPSTQLPAPAPVRKKHRGLWSRAEEARVVECSALIEERDWAGVAAHIGTGRKPNSVRQHFKLMEKTGKVKELEQECAAAAAAATAATTAAAAAVGRERAAAEVVRMSAKSVPEPEPDTGDNDSVSNLRQNCDGCCVHIMTLSL